jgi:epoxyqueuosine reductase
VTPIPGGPGTTLEESIKQEARRLGFVLAGVTTPEPAPHAAFFEAWLGHGRHGHMDYLATQRSRTCRADPRKVMPECTSILVLAMPYSNPSMAASRAEQPEQHVSRGRLAAYAWGRDYHKVITGYLNDLVAFIERCADRSIQSRCYTDTGPILERDLAQRAGLGWIGKNTCLINPRSGSYLLLAEILLDLPLRPDAAFETDHCGSCTRCIEACPTACILSDRTLDARRCISYLTIELRDSIPVELRGSMGEWVFGCDICQTVCPWNRFAAAEGHAALAADHSAGFPSLVESLGLSAQVFDERARGSAVKRAKHRGYLRNAVVASGNVAGSEAIQALESLAVQGDPMIEEHAAWALTQIASRQGRNA